MTGDSDNNTLSEQPDSQPQEAKRKPWLMIIVLLVLLVILGGLGAGAYLGWEEWQLQQQRFSQLENKNGQTAERIQSLVSQQENNVNAQQEVINQLLQNQQALQQRVDSQGQRLSSLSGTSRDDWLLAEASYLLRLANQRLLVDRATEGALGLLESADDILTPLNDRDLLPVRNAIAQEIIELKLANNIDKEGSYLQLVALKKRIQQLPLIPFIQNRAEFEPVAATNDETDSVINSIKNAFTQLGRFVQIRHHDEAPDLLISEQQQLQVINNLSLMFEQAQFALLHEEDVIYKESLLQALEWWQVYYGHYKEYEIVKAELQRLADLSIVQTLPDITRSSALLTDYIERYHRLNLEKPTAQEESAQ